MNSQCTCTFCCFFFKYCHLISYIRQSIIHITICSVTTCMHMMHMYDNHLYISQTCLRSSSLYTKIQPSVNEHIERCINSIALKTLLKYDYKMECIQLSSANVKINIVYFYKVWLVEVSRASVFFPLHCKYIFLLYEPADTYIIAY